MQQMLRELQRGGELTDFEMCVQNPGRERNLGVGLRNQIELWQPAGFAPLFQ